MSERRVIWRFDLDYVPWDTADAADFGHGEPAMVLRLLTAARERGLKFQFFASTRVLRAFPSLGESVLNEGHALDWLCKHPTRHALAVDLFARIGHRFRGIAVVRPTEVDLIAASEFVVSHWPVTGHAPVIPQRLPELRDFIRGGQSLADWLAAASSELQSESEVVVIAARPQALSHVDPQLLVFAELFATSRQPAFASECLTLGDISSPA